MAGFSRSIRDISEQWSGEKTKKTKKNGQTGSGPIAPRKRHSQITIEKPDKKKLKKLKRKR